MRSCESRTGTCLMATIIFINCWLPILLAITLKNEAGVGSAEPKRIGECVIDLHRARMIRYIVQIALRIGVVQVNGRWRNLVAYRKNRDAGLQPTRTA